MAIVTNTSFREKALNALTDLPPFTPVLDRLLATLANESISISRVSDIIETDTVIAGNVLKLVNSALYGRRGTVNSIRHAVSLLGINKLRNAVFAMSITRVWNGVRTAPGWSTAQFNQRAVGCGLLCDCLARRLPINYPEGAFVAGLFHDLGQLLIAVALHDEYQQIQRMMASEEPRNLIDCEVEVIGISHAELSADALALWNLPVAIQRAVRFHHAPDQEPKELLNGKFGLALAIACSEAYSDLPPKAQPPEADGEAMPEPFARLGLEEDAADVLGEFQTEFDALAGMFH